MSRLPKDIRDEVDAVHAKLVVMVRNHCNKIRPRSKRDNRNFFTRSTNRVLHKVSLLITYIKITLRSWLRN